MPKVNLGAKKPDKMQITLNGYINASDLTQEDVGRIIGTGRDTARAKLRRPDDLTVGQLKALGKRLGVPIDELRAALQY